MITSTKFKKINDLLSIIYFFYVFNLILFGRTLNGIQIFGFRIAELVIGFCMFLTIILIFKNKYFLIGKKIFYNLFFLIILFFISLYFSNSSIYEPYTYKASSYIWTISLIYFGTIIFQSKYTESFINYLYITLPFTFVFSFMFFPNPFYNFYINYSDKFDYLKASDILLTYVLLNFLTKRYYPNSDFSFYYFILSSMLLGPVFSFMSRGAFLSFLIYVTIEIILKRNYIRKNILKSILVLTFSSSLFIFSTVVITSDIDFEFLNFGKKLEIKNENQLIEVDRSQFLNEKLVVAFEERDFFGISYSLLFIDGRLYSLQPTVNWRLQLWQDILHDMKQNKKVLIGYGYKDIIPIMQLPDYIGDGTNENLHNYFMQVYAKGGLIQLLLIISNLVLIVLFWKDKKKNLIILQFILPIISVSMFDPSLESARFPMIYYSFLGYFLINENAFKYRNY